MVYCASDERRYPVWLKYCVTSRGLLMRVAEQSTEALPPHHMPCLTTHALLPCDQFHSMECHPERSEGPRYLHSPCSCAPSIREADEWEAKRPPRRSGCRGAPGAPHLASEMWASRQRDRLPNPSAPKIAVKPPNPWKTRQLAAFKTDQSFRIMGI